MNRILDILMGRKPKAVASKKAPKKVTKKVIKEKEVRKVEALDYNAEADV